MSKDDQDQVDRSRERDPVTFVGQLIADLHAGIGERLMKFARLLVIFLVFVLALAYGFQIVWLFRYAPPGTLTSTSAIADLATRPIREMAIMIAAIGILLWGLAQILKARNPTSLVMPHGDPPDTGANPKGEQNPGPDPDREDKIAA